MRELACDEIRDLAAGFVLGSLDPGDMAAVREHLGTCPEAHAEVEALGGVVPALAAAVPIRRPSAALGPRILAAARAEAAAASADATVRVAEAPQARVQQPTSVAVSRPGFLERLGLGGLFERPGWGFAAIAAVLAVAVLGAWNLQLQGQVEDLGAYRTAVLDVVDTAARPGGQLAVLTDANGGAAAGISAVGPNGHLVVAMRNLDPTTGRGVYEAWLIGADGKPLPAGSFQVGSGGTGMLTAQVPQAEAGVRVALTREAAPGATSPTLPIIAQGLAQATAG